MSTGRWRVTGLHGVHELLDWETGETRTEVCTRWGVTSPEGCSHEFFTHAEALAYADQQARTATAELPLAKPGRQKFLQNSYLRGVALDQVVQLVDMADHECIYIDKFDWKELGEYLLALHYHHERNRK